MENANKLYLEFYKNFVLHVFNLSKKISKVKTIIENKEIEKIAMDPSKEIDNILSYLMNRQNLFEGIFDCLEKSFKKAIKAFIKKEANKDYSLSDDNSNKKDEL